MKLKALQTISHDRVTYAPGMELTIKDSSDAERLIASGAAAVVDEPVDDKAEKARLAAEAKAAAAKEKADADAEKARLAAEKTK